jgi:putative redox protein
MFTVMTDETAAVRENGEQAAPPDVVVRGNSRGFLQEIVAGAHHLRADEPESVGGTDVAPDPYDYLLAGLGACTSMTVGLFARKKKWPLEDVTVSLRRSRIHAADCADCETKEGMLEHIDLEVSITGALTDAQRATLLSVAHKCPVHRTLEAEIKINVRAAPDESAPPATN